VSAPRGQQFTLGVQVGWTAALLEIEHQAEHWATPDHGETGRLIAEALRAAASIARTGGLRCSHRGGTADLRPIAAEILDRIPFTRPATDPQTS
jgi:hypothetical protein